MPTYAEATRNLPKRAVLMERYADTNFDVRAGCQASAWAFVFSARERGWIVADPSMGGDLTTWFVTVWQKGMDDYANGPGVPGQCK